MKQMPRETTRVILVAGYGRSGSTLLDRTLGQLPGAVSVGELKFIWSRGFAENELCGCGKPFLECPFWGEVVRVAFGHLSEHDLEHARRLQSEVERMRYVPLHMVPQLQPKGFKVALAEYAELLGRLYGGIAAVAGTNLVVDSSKWPPHAYVVRQARNVELHVVHLVRDSRAVAYSWQRKRKRPEVHWQESYMRLHAPHRTAVEWMVTNYAAGTLESSGAQTFARVRYEDFVAGPERATRSLLSDICCQDDPLSHIHGGAIQLGQDHTISGNPARFEHGSIQVRPDTEWVRKMSRRHRLVVSAITWPLLARYGYLSDSHRVSGEVSAAE